MKKSWVLLAIVPIVAVALLVPPALADEGLVRTTWGSSEDPGPPFYAEIEPAPPHFINDGEWGAVVFYRDPGCVPANFNLLNFFDPPAAFGCDLTMDGSSLWVGEALVGAPKIATMSGNGAVPVWFAPLESLQAAVQDGELRIGELAAVDGLIRGTATHFNGILHPTPLPPQLGGGGHPVPKQSMTAKGDLEDGRSFRLQFSEVKEEFNSTQITFTE